MRWRRGWRRSGSSGVGVLLVEELGPDLLEPVPVEVAPVVVHLAEAEVGDPAEVVGAEGADAVHHGVAAGLAATGEDFTFVPVADGAPERPGAVVFLGDPTDLLAVEVDVVAAVGLPVGHRGGARFAAGVGGLRGRVAVGSSPGFAVLLVRRHTNIIHERQTDARIACTLVGRHVVCWA